MFTDQQKPQGLVIAVDRNDFLPIEGVSILSGCDFTEVNTQTKIKSLLDGKGDKFNISILYIQKI